MDGILTPPAPDVPRQTVVGEFLLDRETIRVFRKDKPVLLSMRQFRLLDLMMRAPDRPFTLGELKDAVWGADSTIAHATVVSEMARLRHALGFRYGKNPIKTVRGVGFMFLSIPMRWDAPIPRRTVAGNT